MNTEILLIIITGLVTLTGLLVAYLLKDKDRKQQEEIRMLQNSNSVLDSKVNELSEKVIHLEDKMWSDEKLTKVIVNAVKSAINEWELKAMKDGWFHNHNRKGDII